MGETVIHPLNCREVTTRMALGELDQYTFMDRFMIRFHLLICWVCRKYERQMKVIGLSFQHVVKQKGKLTASPGYKDRLLNHLQQL